jgi:hypothetical protein
LEPIGSIAAAVQAIIGNVAAGSLFALLQSMAMGGAIPALVSALGGVCWGAIGAAISLLL